ILLRRAEACAGAIRCRVIEVDWRIVVGPRRESVGCHRQDYPFGLGLVGKRNSPQNDSVGQEVERRQQANLFASCVDDTWGSATYEIHVLLRSPACLPQRQHSLLPTAQRGMAGDRRGGGDDQKDAREGVAACSRHALLRSLSTVRWAVKRSAVPLAGAPE